MAGTQSIQRLPKGLIDLLGMRATGETPHQLAQDVGGSIDLKNEYLIDRCVYLSGSTTPVGVGDISTGTLVPAGFQWYVYGISISFNQPVAAAAALQCGMGVQRGPTLGQTVLIPGLITPLVAATFTWQGAANFETPMILRAGDRLSTRVVVFTGAPAVSLQYQLFYAEVGI